MSSTELLDYSWSLLYTWSQLLQNWSSWSFGLVAVILDYSWSLPGLSCSTNWSSWSFGLVAVILDFSWSTLPFLSCYCSYNGSSWSLAIWFGCCYIQLDYYCSVPALSCQNWSSWSFGFFAINIILDQLRPEVQYLVTTIWDLTFKSYL